MSGTQNEKRKMQVSKFQRESIASSSDSSSPSLLDQSVSSVISGLTVDEETFGPTLKSTPEQQCATDPDIQDIEQYSDSVRMTSSSRFCTSIGPSTETSFCVMPKRQSSSKRLDWTDLDDESDDYKDPLQGSYQTTGLEDPSSSQDLSDGRFQSYYPCPSLSLDLDDIFEERKCSDTSPQVAKRKPSLSSIAASSKKAELVVNICEPSSPGDERFEVAPKEKANSITMPSRQMSTRSIA
jgi:hypothetical protein